MKTIAAILYIVLAASCFSAAAVAEDAGASRPSAKVDQDIDQAAGIVVDKSPSDVDSEVKDLEATRAALDKQKTPAISLSVSGWVDQQVQYNVKQ